MLNTLIQLLLSDKCAFWRKHRNGEQRNVAIVCAVIMRRRQKRRKLGFNNNLKNRTYFVALYTLLAELRNPDIPNYRNFLHMDFTSFKELLQPIGTVITRQETNMRSAITPVSKKEVIFSKCYLNAAVSPAAMLGLFRNPRDSKLENAWLTSFNKRQLFERNRVKLCSVQQRSTAVQHVECHISTFNNL